MDTPDSTPAEAVRNEQTFPLALRRVAIDTYRENVAYLLRDCAIYRAEGFQALAKVEVQANGRRVLATLNVVDDPRIVRCNEIGLSLDAFAQLGVENGHPAKVAQAEPPTSIPALHRKIAGERLDRDDFRAIVRDIAEHRYSKIELTAFVVASNQGELDREEVYFLTEAMAAVGQRLDWHERPVVDKHCIGGIPGNRTSMLVVPMLQATSKTRLSAVSPAPESSHSVARRPPGRRRVLPIRARKVCPASLRAITAPRAASPAACAPPPARPPRAARRRACAPGCPESRSPPRRRW